MVVVIVMVKAFGLLQMWKCVRSFAPLQTALDSHYSSGAPELCSPHWSLLKADVVFLRIWRMRDYLELKPKWHKDHPSKLRRIYSMLGFSTLWPLKAIRAMRCRYHGKGNIGIAVGIRSFIPCYRKGGQGNLSLVIRLPAGSRI